MRLPALLRALRPHQWVNNIFVLAAIAFSRADVSAIHPSDGHDLRQALLAFAAFCLGASAIYLVNDVLDVESDRAHPEKKKRPIASGEVSVPTAIGLSIACAASSLALGWFAGGGTWAVLGIVAVYIAMNFAYSAWLKHVVLIDAFCIAIGFILRVKGGARAAETYVSHWLMLCTFFLALFLALCKRRAEIDLLGEHRGEHRANLREYTVGFLDQMVTVLAATTIVCYTMYTVSDDTAKKFGESNLLIYSVPFVVFGLARYMLLVETRRGGGSPTKVLLGGDVLFVLNALAWAGVVGFSLYFAR
ncbi:MAG: decaprenyl-phosphate phosphoribosyltransferase [Planctomycetes bacterium]|nr:decaprenyl-phosphate phosphoribosyltransferase [Planctomycetota bacterium]